MILVYGTICLDRVRRIERFPEPGGYAEVASEHDFGGGEALNTALALAKWGVPVTLVGNPIKGDPAGDLVRAALSGVGLEPVWLGVEGNGEGPTPTCDVYVADDSTRTMFGRGFRGIEGRVELAELERALSATGPEWFTADPNHGPSAREAARRADAAGCRLYLQDFVRADDPVPSGSVWQSSTDWVGEKGNSSGNAAWLAAWTSKRDCFGVLSDGAEGFVAGGLGLPIRQHSAFPCPELVDATGAGDIFRAGMLLGLFRGWDWGGCLRFAAAAGCLNCRGLGGNSAIPSEAEVEALIAAHPESAHSYD